MPPNLTGAGAPLLCSTVAEFGRAPLHFTLPAGGCGSSAEPCGGNFGGAPVLHANVNAKQNCGIGQQHHETDD
jgi:hypothetical protein